MIDKIITPEDACRAYEEIMENGRQIKIEKANLARARYKLQKQVRTQGYERVLADFIADERSAHQDWSEQETIAYCSEWLPRLLRRRQARKK